MLHQFSCRVEDAGDAVSGQPRRLTYTSAVDGIQDWALMEPAPPGASWAVYLHGHGSGGDQLYMRTDLRDQWLPAWRARQLGIVGLNLRGNAWMNPAAVADLHALLGWLRDQYQPARIILIGGSMGGTGVLIYSIRHPEDIDAAIALCPATDVGAYFHWCQTQEDGLPIRTEIATAISAAYGGSPDEVPDRFLRHCVLSNCNRLTMPTIVVHGSADASIPVQQARDLSQKMNNSKLFTYIELSNGDHEAPISCCVECVDRLLSTFK